MFEWELRRAIAASPVDGLPMVTAALWRAYGEGRITEAEASSLSALVEVRRGSQDNRTAVAPLRKSVGSRPRSDASMARRRRWAASGRLPPGLACRFTGGELAALAVVTVEAVKRGDCRLAHEHIAAIAGVSRSTVKRALHQARALGLISVQERRLSRWRNRPNVVAIVDRAWLSWMRLARTGGGVQLGTRTNTSDPKEGSKRAARGSQGHRRETKAEVRASLSREREPGKDWAKAKASQ